MKKPKKKVSITLKKQDKIEEKNTKYQQKKRYKKDQMSTNTLKIIKIEQIQRNSIKNFLSKNQTSKTNKTYKKYFKMKMQQKKRRNYIET